MDQGRGESFELQWFYEYSKIHGRVTSLTLVASNFAQEKFLSAAVELLDRCDPVLIKVAGLLEGGEVRAVGLGDVSIDQEGLE